MQQNQSILKETSNELQFPFFDRPLLATIIAMATGSMDGFTYITAGQFATVLSGNVIIFSYGIGINDPKKWLHPLFSILVFGCGAALTAIFTHFANKSRKTHYWSHWVICAEIILLLLCGSNTLQNYLETWQIALIISFIAGMQGNAFHQLENYHYGNVAITNLVQSTFNYLFLGLLESRSNLRTCRLYLQVLTGFAIGSFFGAYSAKHFLLGRHTLWFTASLMFVLLIGSYISKKRHPNEKIND